MCSLWAFKLTALGAYVGIVPAGLVSLLARRPTSLSVRAEEPRDDQQAHNYGQKAQDAVHCLPDVAVAICCTRVENVARRFAARHVAVFSRQAGRPPPRDTIAM